ncbi:17389_t:CDS:2 [Entrophospora sp. SA101]|nr:22612_t:CDS:2 [Entrophospora sp. SA101]CAJ0757900.1 17389_t:CDS:2 [Entrophospora sp. SA101]CAJ0832531.1 8186_t:CDS:2 [Entrophospora sp. SA101]
MGNEHSICRLKVQLNETSEKFTPAIRGVLGPLQLMSTEKKGTLTKNPAEKINMLADVLANSSSTR